MWILGGVWNTTPPHMPVSPPKLAPFPRPIKDSSCYTQGVPVSIISNLQIKTLVYMKLFCINNYYFRHLH